ncbi:hypothetical protein AKJ09_07501 [Labilithrix luteola]|uniref:Uncharacterized protein n=1 Tax=Labilithrix luteola TaxID=1391654 RepID=A0A0K1Q530_9BACT|nr:tetratricopeptide repeat protein [Labilithrix luteola]AKV00838.1 hypothetical protein AKJ09_07501 [Labilithrix luteola]
MLCAVGISAHAAEGAGATALKLARSAWDRGSLDTAEPLYREALEKGGLAPDEVLEGYVRLGSIRASMGKKDQAVAAFRAASILDPKFAVPSEAGSKGPALANQARKDTAKIGALRLTVTAPKETPSGKSFKVTAQIDDAHARIVAKVGLVARDGTSGKEITVEAKTEPTVELEIPAEITLPNAALTIRVDALDSHNNRLGSAEERVHVPDDRPATASAVVLGPSTNPAADTSHKRGFWSSPWPYVIGGVALAGAGAALYFGTRPADQVSVGSVDVRTR